MLNNLRARLGPALEGMGRRFAATGLSPNFWTSAGLAAAFASAAVYGTGYWLAPVAGGILLLASGFLDVVDGQVARATSGTSARGSFLDSTFDKIAEAAVFMGILAGGYAEPYLVLLAATLSLLVSYARSRAESLGVSLRGIGVGERAERLLVIAVIGMIPGMMWAAVAVVAVIAAATLLHRIVVAARALR